MKVLTLISGGDVGGAKTHVLTLLREVGKHIEAHLVCFMEGDFSAEAREMGIHTRVLDSGNIFRDLRALKQILREEHYDLIHSHGSRGNFMATLVRRYAGLPTLSTVHSDYRLDYMGRPLGALTYGIANARALRRIDYLTGVSDPTTDLLVRRGFSPDRLFTIYNGVDMTPPGELPTRAQFLQGYGIELPEDSLCVGIAARLNPVKDISTLIRAFSMAEKAYPALRLLIAGEGPEEKRLRALCAELGVTDKVFFLGWVRDTDAFYHALDVNTLTSLSETFPYALTEGARFHLATVSSRIGGVPRLIDHGVSGLLFEPGDVQTLAAHLALLASDAQKRRELGRRLYEKVDTYFSLEATCRTQLEIYESVLRRYAHRNDRRYGVAVCGAYGRGNAGDEAILEAILSEIREADPDIPIHVLSKTPKETRATWRVRATHTYNALSFFRLSRRVKLYINGGGSLIQDVTSRRSLWYYLYTIAIAKKHGAKVVMYGCGIGPVNYEGDRRLAARTINRSVDTITLREGNSREELAALGVDRPRVLLAADPALSLPAAPEGQIDSAMLSNGLDPHGRYICFVLRNWPGFEDKLLAFARAADYAFRRYGLTPVFLPINHLKDADAANSVARYMTAPHHIMTGVLRAGVAIGVMARMAAVVSMRLHGLIFAAGHGVPLVGVVYDPKVSSFLRYIGQEIDLDLGEVTAARLIGCIDRTLHQANAERQTAAVARLRELEKVNRRVLLELLAEETEKEGLDSADPT